MKFFLGSALLVPILVLAQASVEYPGIAPQADRIETQGAIVKLAGNVVATTGGMLIKADEAEFQTNGRRELLARGRVTVAPTPELLAELETSRRDLEAVPSDLGPNHPEVLRAKWRVTTLEAQLQRIRDLAAKGDTVRMELGLARPCLADLQDCSELFAAPAGNRTEISSGGSGK